MAKGSTRTWRSSRSHRCRKSSTESPRARFRPYSTTEYLYLIRNRDVLFMPVDSKHNLPQFSFDSSEPVSVITSVHHEGRPYQLRISYLLDHLRKSRSYPAFLEKSSLQDKRGFVLVLRHLHFRLRSLEIFIQDKVLVEQVIGNMSLEPSALIDLSDEALTQEHFSITRQQIKKEPQCHLFEEEEKRYDNDDDDDTEVMESALKDEYNTFDFLTLMNGSMENVPEPSTNNKSTQLTQNRIKFRKAAQLRLQGGGELLFEFFVGGTPFQDKILALESSSLTIKFEEIALPQGSLDILLDVFRELMSLSSNAAPLPVKVDIHFKETMWKVLHVHLPTLGIPECVRIGDLVDVQVSDKDAQILLQFSDGISETIWLNSEDAIDVISPRGPNVVEVWPSYLRKYEKWPLRAGIVRGHDGRWKSIYFSPESKSLLDVRENALKILRKSVRLSLFYEEYILVLRRMKCPKKMKGDTSLLPILSEFLHFINIPPVAHEEMLNSFFLSRNEA